MFTRIINLLFPHLCLACYRKIEEFGLCNNCIEKIQFIKAVCPKCSHNQYCTSCLSLNFDKHVSCAVYDGLMKKLIVNYKIKNDRILAKFFAELLLPFVASVKLQRIIAVPIHYMRLITRRFNQVQDIANIISSKLSLKKIYAKKMSNNSSQRGKNFSERKENVKSAFLVSEDLTDLAVGILDDVYTTGATLDALATELKRCGAKSVYAFTIAKVHNV